MIGFLKGLLLKNGIHVEKRGVYNDPDLRLKRLLDLLCVDTVIDVGANEGQFAQSVFASGFGGKVISFEPLQQQNKKMSLAAARSGGQWNVVPPCALGRSNGMVEFHAAHGHAASSVLAPNKTLTSLGAHYGTQEKIQVRLVRLDDVMQADFPGAGETFLKIDVQGYEMDVLGGADQTLDKSSGIKLEMSLSQLYEGQALAEEVHALLISKGFLLWDLEPGFRDRATGRLLQYDGVYVRRDRVVN